MTDYLIRGSLADIDPVVDELCALEGERQYRKLILIPSESTSPIAVREALASPFHNIYAEGYPPDSWRWLTEEELQDYGLRLAELRRYSSPRYYKGVEFADVVESLARRRCTEVFATGDFRPDDLYVNVQALSGGPANNAVYHALVNPGDTVMGMNLLHGGHLSHGSPVNRSGKYYNIVSYSVNSETEQIDYGEVRSLALQHRPKMIIAGVSSYPWVLDWEKFRQIADEVGAYLFADIAHVAGLVAAGVYPSPIGYADVVTFTTHKSLCGPRGAVIITTNRALARKIDRAVFPGEQGGPHVNVFAGMAVAFKIAQSPSFKELQSQVLANCAALADKLASRGLRLAFGGTNTHLLNVDLRTIKGEDGAWLSGDLAARILDLAGIVVNRNTIPGDKSALNPSGIRMGTPWVTQRGLDTADMESLGDVIADILLATTPYWQGAKLRAKVDFNVLEASKIKVRDIAQKAGIDFQPVKSEINQYYYLDDQIEQDEPVFSIRGEKVREFLDVVMSADLNMLQRDNTGMRTYLYTPQRQVEANVYRVSAYEFYIKLGHDDAALVNAWLNDISDGYIKIDDDVSLKVPGPVAIEYVNDEVSGFEVIENNEAISGLKKPFYIGINNGGLEPLPEFTFEETESGLRRTPLYDVHKSLGAKLIPFAGWEMPVWYTSVLEEHLAVRNAAGLFDVAHMGVYQAEGPDAMAFLDSVCANDISSLAVGESLYTHFLDPDANVIDDLLVYRRGKEKYLVVVNASNDDKDWAWLNAAKDGRVLVDRKRPWATVFGRNVILRNLRDPKEGDDMRVDIALQGPKSRDVLLALGVDMETRKRIMRLKRTNLCEAVVGGFDLVVSRTGYTGEKMAFELFVHPDKAADLFKALLEAGENFGLKPCGLGARDSLRTEAGLPLYGHEMGGELNLGVAEAGFGSYVKTYKPWFIGKDAYIARLNSQDKIVVRFRFNEKGVKMAHLGDPVLDKRGKVIGVVTSCAVDSDGYLTGQAYINMRNAEEGELIYIFQGKPNKQLKTPADLAIGDRYILPGSAMVISRFLK